MNDLGLQCRMGVLVYCYAMRSDRFNQTGQRGDWVGLFIEDSWFITVLCGCSIAEVACDTVHAGPVMPV